MNDLCQRRQAELSNSQASVLPHWMPSSHPNTPSTVTDKWWLCNSGNGVPAFVLVSFHEISNRRERSSLPTPPPQPSPQALEDGCRSLCRYQRRHRSRRYRCDADCSVVYVGLMERAHDKCATLVRSDCTLETLLSDNCAVNCTPECRPDRSLAGRTRRVDLSVSSDALLDLKESSNGDGFVSKQLRRFVRTFGGGYLRVKTRAATSSSCLSIDDDGGMFNSDSLSMVKKLHDVRKNSSSELLARDAVTYEPQLSCADGRVESNPAGFVLEPQSIFYVLWLCLITVAFLYNCWVIPLRTTFPYQTDDNVSAWMIVDYTMDLLYLLDIVLMKPRVMYLEDGFWVRDPKLTRKNYLQKLQFKMDVLSLLPSDLLYFAVGFHYPVFRLPRLLKIQTFWEFFNHFDNILASPYVVRVTRTLTYMLYLVHLNTCAYYAVSVREGIGSNTWVYDGKGNAYIRCFYRATKTATSIGKNPKPSNEIEYLFMTFSWLMGVFVFATLIGQIRDIVATASKSQNEYRKLVDETLDYLRRLNVPPKIRERVEQWFSFTWEQQHTLDENKILDTLPQKLKTDVAINVHIKTLGKVQLFHDCDEALLRDLVLKLRPVLYLPGDYICRKGEVGKEMYIVKTGQVQVVTRRGRDNNVVLATLTEGCVFGEISLLNLAGTNRRTADVRSHGFSSLFVLSKNDLNEAIRYYPNAQKILKQKARQLIRQNASREGREMPLEIMCDSNDESLSKTVAIDTTAHQPLSTAAKKETSSASERKQQQPHRVAIYRNKYSSLKRYSDAQVNHFVRLRKRRNKMRMRKSLSPPQQMDKVSPTQNYQAG